MAEPVEGFHFSGVLSRVERQDGLVRITLHPFAIDASPDSKPVLQIEFTVPDFDVAALARFKLEEVDVGTHADRVHIWNYEDDTPTALTAQAVHTAWRAYDTIELVEHVNRLISLLNRSETIQASLRDRIDRTAKLIRELVRRAEIKGDARPDLQRQESTVVSALERVLNALETDT